MFQKQSKSGNRNGRKTIWGNHPTHGHRVYGEPFTAEQRATLQVEWNSGTGVEQLCQSFDCSSSKIRSEVLRAKTDYNLHFENRRGGRLSKRPTMEDGFPEITPEEIAERTAEVRAGWTIQEEQARRGLCPQHERPQFSERQEKSIQSWGSPNTDGIISLG